jgi:cellulose synthase (UDP-forming)
MAEIDAATAPVLAPTDEEVYYYLGPQQRWIQVSMTLAFLVAAFSLLKFVTTGSVLLYPMLLVLLVNVVGVIVSAFGGLNKRRISRKSHDDLIYGWRPDVVPSVDVFLPSCGEDMEVLLNTYRHVAAMDWPAKLTVWVLDDSDRPVVKEAAADFGFEYRVRPNRGHMKKAGNLLYGYQQSEGDHIVIFDADFCPRPDFLAHLIPYMDDPKVGIVQSPQSFDTDDAKGWLERGAGATQELFYRWIQPSRDAAGAPICVGTCAVYRRAALQAVGGFAQIEHSEDVHTGILLMRNGFGTRYVPVLVAKGLCPDDLAGFLNQQYRWCNGSITLLRSGQAQRHPLTFRQRLCFWGGFMYYIGTAVNVFTLHVPGIVMALAYPSQIHAANYVEFLPGLWVYFVLLPMAFKGKWRYDVLRVQMAYSFCHATAIFHKLTGRTAGWVATGAVTKKSSLARTISKVGLVGIMVPLLLAWAGLCYDLPRYSVTQLWPQMAFLTLYTYLGLPLAGGFAEILWPAKDSTAMVNQPVVPAASVASA